MYYHENMRRTVIKLTPAFERKAKKWLSEGLLDSLYDSLETNPKQGDIIRGTGGVRKLRWKSDKGNKGKSGGVRILYHYSNDVLVLLITLFSKSEKENISQLERNELKKLIPKLVKKYLGDLK